MLTIQPPLIDAVPKAGSPLHTLSNIPVSAIPLAIAEIASRSDSLVLVLVEKSQDAQQLANALHFYLGQEHHLDAEGEADGLADIPIVHLPDWETLPYDSFSPHEDITSERLKALSQLGDLHRGLLILPIQTLAHRLPPREHLDGQRFILKLVIHSICIRSEDGLRPRDTMPWILSVNMENLRSAAPFLTSFRWALTYRYAWNCSTLKSKV